MLPMAQGVKKTSIHIARALMLPTPCIVFPFSYLSPWAFTVILYEVVNTLFTATAAHLSYSLFLPRSEELSRQQYLLQ